jgi:hypothetical protein
LIFKKCRQWNDIEFTGAFVGILLISNVVLLVIILKKRKKFDPRRESIATFQSETTLGVNTILSTPFFLFISFSVDLIVRQSFSLMSLTKKKLIYVFVEVKVMQRRRREGENRSREVWKFHSMTSHSRKISLREIMEKCVLEDGIWLL